jgi:hypothetical protein
MDVDAVAMNAIEVRWHALGSSDVGFLSKILFILVRILLLA